MLTHIEIDGFKSFEGFSLDLSPFTVILGGNASGKSNLFDAIQLLSRLAAKDVRSAVKGLRGAPEHLFREIAPSRVADEMTLSAEVLLDPVVKDPWGERVKLTHTRIRYTVKVARRLMEGRIPRLVILEEKAAPIFAQNDKWTPYGKKVHNDFAKTYMPRSRRRTPWLDTIVEKNKRIFTIYRDGKAGRPRPAEAAEASVLSSITTAEFPHLL